MEHFDLAVIGSGSGNVALPEHADGRKAALVESGPFGGTCVNRGCIPSKMFAYTADVAMLVRGASEFGIRSKLESIDWPSIRDGVAARTKDTSEAGREARIRSPHITLFEGHGRFVGPHEIAINEHTRIAADQIIVATGGRPSVPDVVTNSGVPYRTSDTIMELDELPSSIVILGGGYVAAELAHLFSSLGVDIRIITAAETLVEKLDEEIARRFTSVVAKRWSLYLDHPVSRIRADGAGVVVILDDGTRVSGELLLVATGRQPNTEDLGLERAGIGLRDDGHIVVDKFGLAAPGVWALGDVSSPFELKHVANAEARIISYNLSHAEDPRPLPHDWVPSAVFSSPQIASVGARSQDLEGCQFVASTQEYSDTAFGWALHDHVGFCKLYADPGTGTLLGAHILGHEASLLITPLIQAVAHGQRVADLARGQYWIHPALSEVVENALLKLPVEQRVLSGRDH
jgi:mycothione reductase